MDMQIDDISDPDGNDFLLVQVMPAAAQSESER